MAAIYYSTGGLSVPSVFCRFSPMHDGGGLTGPLLHDGLSHVLTTGDPNGFRLPTGAYFLGPTPHKNSMFHLFSPFFVTMIEIISIDSLQSNIMSIGGEAVKVENANIRHG
jgi:hypothetical protein